MSSNNFKEHYIDLPSNVNGNKNPSLFTQSLSSDLDKNGKLRKVTGDVDNIVLVVDEEGQVMIMHSMHNKGGTLRRQKNNITGVIGLDPRRTCYEVLEDSFGNNCLFDVPNLKAYKE